MIAQNTKPRGSRRPTLTRRMPSKARTTTTALNNRSMTSPTKRDPRPAGSSDSSICSGVSMLTLSDQDIGMVPRKTLTPIIRAYNSVMREEQRWRWRELTQLLDRSDRGGPESLRVDELKRLCHLYRQVAIDLSRTRAAGDDVEGERYLNLLATRAHGTVDAVLRGDVEGVCTFL